MYRFIDFNDEKVDPMLLMELTDLAKTLSRVRDIEVQIRVHSYLSMKSRKLYVSHFWEHRPERVKKAGMKSDVFLKAFGNSQFTDFRLSNHILPTFSDKGLMKFGTQLFVLAEDLRIEELCKKYRPGMVREFNVRREVYTEYFQSQLTANLNKNAYTDALFCFIYLFWNKQTPLLTAPSFFKELDKSIPQLVERLENFYDVQTTKDCLNLVLSIIEFVNRLLPHDLINDYFHWPNEGVEIADSETFHDLLRKDPLQNDDSADSSENEEEVFEEEMKTWHRETENPGESFLQFDLNQGTKTDISADAREGEAGDQALAIVQGTSKKTARKDFSELEAIEKRKDEHTKGNPRYGKANKDAIPIFLQAAAPTDKNMSDYAQLKNDTLFYQKKLKNLIERTPDRKETEPRTHLARGRLDKNLVRFFTDEDPKIFYKKMERGREIDAVFSLLVDCSASMHDKMEETKRGIILFHEALKSVNVPHEVTGFWEDANEVTPEKQPNYFKQVINFSNSLLPQTGPEVMKMEAEEDNRDGFAIRIISEKLVRRQEKQKFLIVFSDGEPAAFGYDQNGIVDTHEAVVETRKRGIEVFNIFLSSTGVGDEQQKVFQNIYGNRSIIAPDIEQLPDILFPLLKRLLNQSIL